MRNTSAKTARIPSPEGEADLLVLPSSTEPQTVTHRKTVQIVAVDAFPVRRPADELGPLDACFHTIRQADSDVFGSSAYQWSGLDSTLGPLNVEAALVRLTTDCGLVGWGEAQAPLASQVIGTVVELLLKPVLEGAEFGGTIQEIEQFWSQMYSAMRVRGQAGGIVMDAISAIDLALWDLAGKIAGVPVSTLLANHPSKSAIRAYVGGLPGDSPGKQADAAVQFVDQGFTDFKLHYDRDYVALLQSMIALRNRAGSDVGIAVDALWRLAPWTAAPFGRLLDEQQALWLECPLPPEQYTAHGDLARAIKTPIALGESYRSCFELTPFFQAKAMQIVQPDLGRCGLTEAERITQVASLHNKEIVPHVSAGFGPQLAAALQLAAASANCKMMEYKPWQLKMANRYLKEKIRVVDGTYLVPNAPGLGVTVSSELL